MRQTKTLTNYDANAWDFDRFRQPNPYIAQQLIDAFSTNEGPILSIGCGTGQYEEILSRKFAIVGMDRSTGMIGKAKERISNVILGDMTFLPFAKNSFSGAYFMQSLHHVGANLSIGMEQRNESRKKVLKETLSAIERGPLFIVQRDPSQNLAVWFWKFFPRALEIKMMIQPKIEMLAEWLENLGLENVSISGHDNVGGLVGRMRIGSSVNTCFWDIITSGEPNMCGIAEEGVCDPSYGRVTAEMQTANTFLEADWDFVGETPNGTEDIWWIDEGLDYPRLWWELDERR